MDDDRSVAPTVQEVALSKTREVVNTVVGENPKYAGPTNVCLKIARRLRDFLVKYNPNTMGVRKFAVIVGTGSYNPLTRMHLRAFFLGKQHLESKSDYVVLGSLLSPAHPSLVRQRYRSCPNENMPPLHRLAIAQMCVESSKWMSVDPWEITRRRAMDYSSMLEHTTKMLQHNFPSIDIRVFYLCKSNAIPLISPQVLREGNYGCICVTRPQESDQLRKSLGARWNSLIYIADDTAILDAAMDKISAKNVRDRLKEGKSIVPLVGQKMAEYFADHRIREKMIGEEEWDDEEKRMVKINSRNPAPLLSPTKEGHEDAAGADNDTGSARSSPSSPMREARQPHSPWKAAQLSKPSGGGSGSKEGEGEHNATSISDTWDENASSGSPRVSPRDKPPTMPVLPEVSVHVGYSNMAGGGDAEMQ
jgi:nicotinic acid mononucleotide adenylyltransferase